MRHFELYKKFIEESGRFAPPPKDLNGCNLQGWAAEQRTAKRIERIRPDRLRLLESINFSWNTMEDYWNYMFSLVEKYIKTTGDCCVSVNGAIQDGVSLRNFAVEQRSIYAKGVMRPDKYARLKEIGFVFNVPQYQWMRSYNALAKYQSLYGTTVIEQRKGMIDGINLTAWTHTQRIRYMKGKLEPYQLDLLRGIGLRLEDRRDAEWNSSFDRYVKGIKDGVDTRFTGDWRRKQRFKYRNGDLEDWQIAKLKSIDFEFDTEYRRACWEASYEKYKAILGKATLSDEEKVYKSNWEAYQIHNYRFGLLSAEQISLLLSLGFDVVARAGNKVARSREDAWNYKYELVKEYIIKFKSMPICTTVYKEEHIGGWIMDNLARIRQGKQSHERIDKLLRLGVIVQLPDGTYKKVTTKRR